MRKFLLGTIGLGLGTALVLPATAAGATPVGAADSASVQAPALSETSLRVATMATALSGEEPTSLVRDLLDGSDPEAIRVADAITATAPDLVVLTGMDAEQDAVDTFVARYLNNPQDDRPDVDYAYSYLAVGSKGLQSGADLDNDRIVGGPGDAWGQGAFAEQGSVVVLSRYPIDDAAVSSVSALKWSAVPGNHLHDAGLDGALAAAIPVMNNGLWDIPLEYRGQRVHVLAAQTEPAQAGYGFADVRQHDQLHVVEDYIAGAGYVVTDQGAKATGLANERYVLTGTLAQREEDTAEANALAAALGREEPINNSGNYLIPGGRWTVLGQGHLGTAAEPLFQTLPGATPDVIKSSELIWADVQF